MIIYVYLPYLLVPFAFALFAMLTYRGFRRTFVG